MKLHLLKSALIAGSLIFISASVAEAAPGKGNNEKTTGIATNNPNAVLAL